MELIIASSNPFKIRELRTVAQELLPSLTIRSLIDFPNFEPLNPEGESFEQNASQKAVHAARLLQKPCVADDSGLVVLALGGCAESLRRKKQQPAGKMLPDTKRLLNDMSAFDEAGREAFLECAIAFATPESGLIKTVSARMEGVIAPAERGPATFDFASIFIKHEYGKTMAQLSPDVQKRISHRRKAFEKLVASLRQLVYPFQLENRLYNEPTPRDKGDEKGSCIRDTGPFSTPLSRERSLGCKDDSPTEMGKV